MIRAWRLADGRYRLVADRVRDWPILDPRGWMLLATSLDDTRPGLVVDERLLGALGAQRVYGVVAGPSSCGCEPARFRWAAESEVGAARTARRPCPNGCVLSGKYLGGAPRQVHHCTIIEVCGEADVAEEVYDAEFRSRVEALA